MTAIIQTKLRNPENKGTEQSGLFHRRHQFLLAQSLIGAVFIGSSLSTLPAFAQAIPSPGQQNAGLIHPALLTPSNLEAKEAAEPTRAALDEVRLESPEEAAENADYRVQTPAFMVRQLKIEGATLFPEQELHALVASYEGREQTLEVLNTAAEAITKRYRDKGYLTTLAYIPPQEVENGVLTIHVQEGRVGEVSLEGAKYYKAKIVSQTRLSQKPGDLLNVRVLEDELNRSNRLNDGYRFKAILTAGEVPGQTNIKIKVAERKPFQISPSFDNQGRPYIGLYRSGVELQHESLTGHGDTLSTRWLSASGTQVAMASYSLPINRFGTELNTSFSYSNVDVDLGDHRQPQFSSRAFYYGLGLTHPLDKDHHWTLNAGLNWRHISDFVNNDRSNLTDVRGLQAGLTYNKYDRWGRTYNRFQGISALGGLGGTSRFFKVDNYFTRIVVLPKRNMLIFKSYAQWSPSALPVAEQFQLGGYNSIRGFTEGILLGDKGFSAGLEHRFPIPGLSKVSPWLDQRLQGAVFYDVGRTWMNPNNDRFIAGRSNSARNTLLQSVGFGFRTQVSRYMQGFVDVGFGLGDRKNLEALRQQPSARVHIGLRTDLLPNDYMVRNRNLTPLMARPLPIEPLLSQRVKAAHTE